MQTITLFGVEGLKVPDRPWIGPYYVDQILLHKEMHHQDIVWIAA